MRLQYLAADITVPNSQLGNTETLQSNAIIRENRGLQPISFKSADWPVNVLSKYSLKTMNLTERTNIMNFLIVSAGQEITLTDHDGVVWIGVVITPIPEVITTQDNCSYDIEFEFLGRKI